MANYKSVKDTFSFLSYVACILLLIVSVFSAVATFIFALDWILNFVI